MSTPRTDISLPINLGVGRTLVVGTTQKADGGFGTIQAAVNLAQPGDTIHVQPGTYDETVTVSRDYITIVGAQKGRYGWPDLAPTTGVALIVTGQGFVAKNIRFVSNDSDVVQQQANGFKYIECVFDSGTGLAATEGLLLLKGNTTDTSKTASEGLIKDCLFRRDGAAGKGIIMAGAETPNGVGSSDNMIVNCRFQTALGGTAGTDIITADNSTVNATYSVKNLTVVGCWFADKNKTNYIDLTTANGGAASDQTGTIMDCYFATDSITTTNIAMVGTGFTLLGCYDTVGVQDGSGLD